MPALGVDLSAVAQRLCRRRRTPMVRRDVFGPLPGEGTWGHVLLADGNIGIGGDPLRLLHRATRLLRPGGTLLVETDATPDLLWRGTVRLRTATGTRRSAAVGVRGCGRAGRPRGDARAAPDRPLPGGAQLRRAHVVRAGVRAGRRSGRVSSKRQPGPEFTTESRPPCASVRARAMASPSPAPESGPGVRAAAPR